MIVIWIVYGFEIKDGLPAATYWRGLIKIYTEYSQGYPTFLFGEVSRTGWWYYFPITFLVKTPLPTLMLFVAGSIVVIKQRRTRHASALLIPSIALMSLAMLSPFNIGYRHILAVLPFVIMIAGQASTLAARAVQLPISNFQKLRRACSVVLIGWLIIGTVAIYPYHLSYFNELIGGPRQADRVLVDSNLDWGQDLPSLKALMQQRGLECVNLAYFGTALPAVYDVHYSPLPGFLHFVIGPEMDAFNPYTPEPGWYAISATSLRLGLLYRNTDLYQYFQDKTPIDRAGYSIGLYEVKYPPDTPVNRAVVVGVPTYYVPASTLGLTPNARVNVKWVDNPDAFIFAMSGPARYLANDPLPFDRALRKEFRSAGRQDGEALIVDARPIVQSHLGEWQSSPKPRLPDGTQLDWPINFDSKLALIGYRIDPKTTPGGELDLITYWQVTGELNGCESLAYFAHVTTDQPGDIRGQYDGWNIAQRGLEVGDVVIQHARLPIHADTSPGTYQVRLGLYSPDTSQRLMVNGTATDHVLLSPIQIAEP